MEVGDEDYDWVTLYDGSDACCILITSDSWVSNLNIWNLFVEDVADDGTVTCSTTLAGDDCHWDTVTLDTPIAVQLIFLRRPAHLWHLLRGSAWHLALFCH